MRGFSFYISAWGDTSFTADCTTSVIFFYDLLFKTLISYCLSSLSVRYFFFSSGMGTR